MLTLMLALITPAEANWPNLHTLDQSTSPATDVEEDDDFGSSLTSGDYNNDGYMDLAIGSPGETIGSAFWTGSVTVHYGGSNGLDGSTSVWSQNSIDGSTNEDLDGFGAALATGNFDGDQYDDIFIGWGDDVSGFANAGRVAVKYGTYSGVTSTAPSDSWSQGSFPGNGSQEGDMFGKVLAVGNFNGDNYDDVAIAAPGDEIGGEDGAGRVVVMYGSITGLSPTNSEAFNQNLFPNRANEAYDQFGAALAAGDFDNDGYDDLAIGIPGEDHSGIDNVGAVVIKFGGAGGLKSNTRTETIDHADFNAWGHDDDSMGQVLAAGDVNGDGIDDLALGIPYQDANGATNAGLVAVLLGHAGTGLLPSTHRTLLMSSIGGQLNTAYSGLGGGLHLTDLDGDGMDDVVAGAILYGSAQGRIAVFWGSTGSLTAGSFMFSESEMGGMVENYSAFGQILGSGDFDDDGTIELAVGLPSQKINGHDNAGVVFTADID